MLSTLAQQLAMNKADMKGNEVSPCTFGASWFGNVLVGCKTHLVLNGPTIETFTKTLLRPNGGSRQVEVTSLQLSWSKLFTAPFHH